MFATLQNVTEINNTVTSSLQYNVQHSDEYQDSEFYTSTFYCGNEQCPFICNQPQLINM